MISRPAGSAAAHSTLTDFGGEKVRSNAATATRSPPRRIPAATSAHRSPACWRCPSNSAPTCSALAPAARSSISRAVHAAVHSLPVGRLGGGQAVRHRAEPGRAPPQASGCGWGASTGRRPVPSAPRSPPRPTPTRPRRPSRPTGPAPHPGPHRPSSSPPPPPRPAPTSTANPAPRRHPRRSSRYSTPTNNRRPTRPLFTPSAAKSLNPRHRSGAAAVSRHHRAMQRCGVHGVGFVGRAWGTQGGCHSCHP